MIEKSAILQKQNHRPTTPIFQITSETYNPRDLYDIEFYSIDNEQYLSCMYVYSKFTYNFYFIII